MLVDIGCPQLQRGSGPALAEAGVTGDPCTVPWAFILLPQGELAHG
jgi:hypothetical protein